LTVITGLERWLRDGAEIAGLSPGARIGLLAHPASVDARARHAVDLLLRRRDSRLVRLFAPEHGLWGREQDMEPVRTTSDPHSGLPVVSLYGADATSLRPRPEDLSDLDAIVFDLQDVGSRYYTFVYTLSHVMEAGRDADIAVVVLDRPNPIGGRRLEGPVLQPEMASFVGRYPLPVRHAMTAGELARLFNDEFGIGCDLRIVPLEGWSRDLEFHGTGLPWVPPSPNMPTPATARVYPGGCLVEGTNLSEGRGTTTPFELVGAPWLDGHALAETLTARALPGALFRPASFRPAFQKHAGSCCSGVQVIVSDPGVFRPFVTYLALIVDARNLDREHFGWRGDVYEFESERPAIDLLLGRADLRPRLESGESLDELQASWADELSAFEALRGRFLLYA
jgi:uncharacterized protein YbbC (DUF1343 family)